MSGTSGDFLERILRRKRAEIEQLADPARRRSIEQALRGAPRVRDFASALAGRGWRIIAELKRASPSCGRLLESYDPAEGARAYEAGGAAALSVLTDSENFEGDLSHLGAAREQTALPVLRKDFILDASQIEESRGAGADAILLIVAALPGPLLAGLLEKARHLGMEPLVEVHDAAELRRALEAGARVVGVNNRNLRTFEVDLEVSLRLAAEFPPGVLKVSESGITSRPDLERLRDAGYDAFLIGEALARSPDPAARLQEWTR
jgi:indole-3-glycerol phosphate synthase